MTDHTMAITTTNNNNDGSKNHMSSLQDGSAAYRHAYVSSQNSGERRGDRNDNVMPIMFVAITIVILLLRLVCCGLHKEEAGGGADNVGQPPPPLSSRAGGLADSNPSTVAAVEVAMVPLVCTYRKEDGADESCGVCLAELADGEALRVLPACMHFFHAACVNEWLRGHDTCPLCRAPLVAPDAGDAT